MTFPNPAAWATAALAGGHWATRELAHLRATLGPEGLNARVQTPPPTLERGSLRGALIALRARRASCLERSLVVQAWFAAAGMPVEIIVGVRRPDRTSGAPAHAWVDGWDDDFSSEYAEIRRV